MITMNIIMINTVSIANRVCLLSGYSLVYKQLVLNILYNYVLSSTLDNNFLML